MSIRLLIREHPSRSIALATSTHALIFRYTAAGAPDSNPDASSTSLPSAGAGGDSAGAAPKCAVEFAQLEKTNFEDYRSFTSLRVYGTLGLITLNGDVFLCVVSAGNKVATVRGDDESVMRILGVEFHCLSSSAYDHILNDEVNPYPTDSLGEDGFEYGHGNGKGQSVLEHPALALKKLLSSGTFYYSADFDLTRRVQDRAVDDAQTIALDSLDGGFLWNSYMIKPLVDFRSRLSEQEKADLDQSRLLTSAIRGFVQTIPIPPSSSPVRSSRSGLPSCLTLISRLSCRRAGTRFNSRGIDDDGNVANFVETETIFWSPSGQICFSYAQVRGSVPIFWEQSTGLLPGQQKISLTRSAEATQPAFDRHFESLQISYGMVHVVNLLSHDKPSEVELGQRYHYHIQHSALNRPEHDEKGDVVNGKVERLRETRYDFHAETRGPGGYEMAQDIRRWIQDSADSFAYFLSEQTDDHTAPNSSVPILHQEGAFRTNCLDCLDRTNVVQTVISQMALQEFLGQRSENATPDFWMRHSSLWADNGDTLSRIYAGTGALKSSFTRHGKMSLAGALADVRKSATRMYINNFEDKGRQNTIDMLLGRLIGQAAVHLFDPINDYVQAELHRRAGEYATSTNITIWAGTFNLNGRTDGISSDLSAWLCPPGAKQFADIVVIGFQEIVELSPQQIMSTDPARRQAWENAALKTLNREAAKSGQEEYVFLRGGQLVGASLSVFAKQSSIGTIKNVEGATKKTGMSGMAGNKGAVAIRMVYGSTSLCFVTAHLAAGFANYEERNRDYRTISHGLKFNHNRSIEDHDNIIWLGDFNYRIGLSYDKTRRLVEARDLETLYANDQLNLQMVWGNAFRYYSEARINFNPTYKYDVGTDNYDSSEKNRIPAWCDRILRKGDSLRQTAYEAVSSLRFSDHRPVYAQFDCAVFNVDERKKEALSAELYQLRKASLEKRRESIISLGMDPSDAEDEDEEDLLGYDSIEPGLPPASSDRRKWWLDNGLPSRSTVVPPKQGNGYVPNPQRPLNPFMPSEEAEWVRVDNAPKLPPRTNSGLSVASAPQPSTVGQPLTKRRTLPPPLEPEQLPMAPKQPVAKSRTWDQDMEMHSLNSASHQPPALRPSLGGQSKAKPHINSNLASPPVIPARKPSLNVKSPPPTIPRKPMTLTAQHTGNASGLSTPGADTDGRSLSYYSAREALSPMEPASDAPPQLPPARRSAAPAGPNRLQKLPSQQSMSTVSSVSTITSPAGQRQLISGPAKLRKTPSPQRLARMPQGRETAGTIPPLPPRHGATTATVNPGLMDEDDARAREGLRDWEVLRPG